MCKRKNRKGVTLVELLVAFTIIVIIFAAIVPQFRAIRKSWASAEARAEIIQNGRVLAEHITRNLAAAKQIVSVSPSGTTTGFIVFKDNNDIQKCYMFSGGYVVFGDLGSEEQLAGPVSRFQISCWDVNDLDNPTIDGNSIRFVQIETDFSSTGVLGVSKTFTTSAYLQTNADTNGLGGCWKLNETSGKTAVDSSGNGNNGTLVNMSLPGCWVTGLIGGALALDGSDDYVDLGDNSSLNFGVSEPFTITAWIKTTDEYGLIVSFRNSEDDGSDIDLGVGTEGGDDDPGKAMILVRQDGGGEWASVVSGPLVNDGQWHHVAAVRSSDNIVELFLDGVSQGTSSGSESGGAITSNVRAIGSEVYWDCGGDEYCSLAGTIDDVRIYKRALTAVEIAKMANILRCGEFTEAKVAIE